VGADGGREATTLADTLPADGQIVPVRTRTGDVRLYQVLKGNRFRLTLVPLTERQELEARAEQDRRHAYARFLLAISVAGAYGVARDREEYPDLVAYADATVEANPVTLRLDEAMQHLRPRIAPPDVTAVSGPVARAVGWLLGERRA